MRNYRLKNIVYSTLYIIIVFLFMFSIVFGGFYIYYRKTRPSMALNFEEYGGLDFDYHDEIDGYCNKYYYNQLVEDEVKLYRAMYHAAINNSNKFVVSYDTDMDDLLRACYAFDRDFPEYYWFSDWHYESKCIENFFRRFNFYYIDVESKCYDFDVEDILTNKKLIDDKVNLIIDELKGDSDYETCKNIFDWLSNNIVYDLDYKEMSDIRAGLIEGRAVCSSYSQCFQYLCNKMGIECYCVAGTSIFNEVENSNDDDYEYKNMDDISDSSDLNHEWCAVRIGDSWYWVDPTWGDANFSDRFGSDYDDYIDYTRLFVPDDIFFITHKTDGMFKYPICDDYSLFLNNNLGYYIEGYDLDYLKQIIIDAFKNGKSDLLFYFNDGDSLIKFNDWVCDEKGVFSVYQNNIYPYFNGKCKTVRLDNNALVLYLSFSNIYY